MKATHRLGMTVALVPIALAMSCASCQPQALSPETPTSPTNQAHRTGVWKVPDGPATNRNGKTNTHSSETLLQRATNGLSSKQTVTGAEVVEIVRQHIVRVAPSAKFEMGAPQFSEGQWNVLVYFLPFGPGRDVDYKLSAEGEIIDRRAGY